MRTPIKLLITAFIIIACVANIAYGHAIVVSATPSQREVVTGPDIPISLKFNSRVDAKRSRLTLVSAGGGSLPLTIRESAISDTLSSAAKGLKSGSYILRWQVLATDGHITRGEVSFSVK
jgi:methionine-rich copper-binding protein CopC